MMIPLADTWTCMACARERPDESISVATAKHKIPMADDDLPPVWVTMTVRYCNDRRECGEWAMDHAFTLIERGKKVLYAPREEGEDDGPKAED